MNFPIIMTEIGQLKSDSNAISKNRNEKQFPQKEKFHKYIWKKNKLLCSAIRF